MVLHIGGDTFVPLSNVIAVLDVRAHPERAAQALPQGGDVRRVGAEEIKSVIVAQTGKRRVFFLSPISAQTLHKRAESGSA